MEAGPSCHTCSSGVVRPRRRGWPDSCAMTSLLPPGLTASHTSRGLSNAREGHLCPSHLPLSLLGLGRGRLGMLQGCAQLGSPQPPGASARTPRGPLPLPGLQLRDHTPPGRGPQELWSLRSETSPLKPTLPGTDAPRLWGQGPGRPCHALAPRPTPPAPPRSRTNGVCADTSSLQMALSHPITSGPVPLRGPCPSLRSARSLQHTPPAPWPPLPLSPFVCLDAPCPESSALLFGLTSASPVPPRLCPPPHLLTAGGQQRAEGDGVTCPPV